jgi:3-oxochol-4-en-24-oyl-CoA dehydrogenase
VPLAISETHREIESVARSFLERNGARAAARALLDAPEEALPPFWPGLVELGWLGLHLPEEHGGAGYGIAELAVVLQELGRALAPGPFLPSVMASAVIAAAGSDTQRKEHLPGLADGSIAGALGTGGSLRLSGGRLDGDGGVVLGAGLADLFVLTAGADLVVVDTQAAGLTVTVATNLDPTRRCGTVRAEGVEVGPDRVIAGGAAGALDLSWLLAFAQGP